MPLGSMIKSRQYQGGSGGTSRWCTGRPPGGLRGASSTVLLHIRPDPGRIKGAPVQLKRVPSASRLHHKRGCRAATKLLQGNTYNGPACQDETGLPTPLKGPSALLPKGETVRANFMHNLGSKRRNPPTSPGATPSSLLPKATWVPPTYTYILGSPNHV